MEAKGSTSFLCDPDALLSKKGAIAVHEMLDTIRGELKVPCPGGKEGGGEGGQAPPQEQQKGLQVGVALVHKLKRTKHDVVEEAEGFARALHGMWGVGDAACQNGVLLFLSRVDRTMYISRGKGVENLLTDDRIDQVMSDLKGLLRGGDWDGGVLMAVGKVAEWVDMGPPGFWERWGGMVVMLMVVMAFLSFALWQERQKYLDRQGYEDAKRKLERIEREQTRLQSLELAESFEGLESCPICLEDFGEEEGEVEGGGEGGKWRGRGW